MVVSIENEREVHTSEAVVDLKQMVEEAAYLLPRVSPLQSFIAANPLKGFEEYSFEEAVAVAEEFYGHLHEDSILESVNREVLKWVYAYYDCAQSSLKLPRKEEGLFAAWQSVAPYDKVITQGVGENKKWLRELPKDACLTIQRVLDEAGVSRDLYPELLKCIMRLFPGILGYVRTVDSTSLTDFVAVWFCTASAMGYSFKTMTSQKAMIKREHREIVDLVLKNENSYTERLLQSLKSAATKSRAAEVQFIFCIDARSEPMRRSLEVDPRYETFGAAGFFGLPVRVREPDTNYKKDVLPALLSVQHEVNYFCSEKNYVADSAVKSCLSVYQNVKHNIATPLALVETLGPWCGIWLGLKTLAPQLYARCKQVVSHWVDPKGIRVSNINEAVSVEERANWVASILKSIDLTENFAPLVVLVGHGATTSNNAFASALQCGACGGNCGSTNATMMAEILNDKVVRKELQRLGINIPISTLFVPGRHDTTANRLSVKPAQSLSTFHQVVFERLEKGINMAHNDAVQCHDWSETRPEWGLARNAAFIIGQREWTRDLDLEGRCFLHSYNWENDFNGQYLESILTAPFIVAQWINMQYLFSTVNPVTYGAGSKVTHNVIAGLGVIQGCGGDLMHGLPLQSVRATDDQYYHEPQRLLGIVDAPSELVEEVLSRRSELKQLLINGWARLVVRDPKQNCFFKFSQEGKLEVI